MRVEDSMKTRPDQVSLDHSLLQIQELFKKHGFHHLLVVEEDIVVGVISDRDLLREISPFMGTIAEEARDRETLAKKAHQIMTRRLVTISREASLFEAGQLMLEKNVSCLPVVAKGTFLEGLLTRDDLLKALLPIVEELYQDNEAST